MQASVQPLETQLAGVGQRLGAVLIDGVVIGIPFALAGAAAGKSGAIAALLSLVGLGAIIYNLLLFARGKSIGKKLLGLTVVAEGAGQPVGFWRMLFREWIGKAVSGSIFYLGFLWAIWDGRRQAWHDKIFGTLVVEDAA